MNYSTPEVKTLASASAMQQQQEMEVGLWFYVETVAVVALVVLAVISQIDVTP